MYISGFFIHTLDDVQMMYRTYIISLSIQYSH